MKNVSVLIFAMCFLIGNDPAECVFENMFKTIYSFFGQTWNPEQYRELPTSVSFKGPQSGVLTIESESQHDPLALVLYNEAGYLFYANANPILFHQYIQTEYFYDIIFACPKTTTDDDKQTTNQSDKQPPSKLPSKKNEKSTKYNGNTTETTIPEHTLAIQTSYLTLVKQHETQTKQPTVETTVNNPDLEAGEGNSIGFVHKGQGIQGTTALDDARNFKCSDPITPHLFESKKQSPTGLYKTYGVGFEVNMEMYDNLVEVNFGNSLNPKNRLSWSMTIVFSHSKLGVVCVHHEVQFNKDIFSPEINESFDDHEFGEEVMFSHINIASMYERTNQEKVFRKLFKNELERKQYFDPDQNKILAKVHLAPLHGFTTPVLRQAARTYGNVAPMWNVIKNGSWRKVENYIHYLTRTFENFTVVSGTYGTLELDKNEIFLSEEDKLPVPLAFWKLVVYGAALNESYGIFIVTINNPYEKIDYVLCGRNDCKKYGWEYIQEDDYTKGCTTCCEFPYSMTNEIPILHGAAPDHVLNLNKASERVDVDYGLDISGQLSEKWKFVKNPDNREVIQPEGKVPSEKLEGDAKKGESELVDSSPPSKFESGITAEHI